MNLSSFKNFISTGLNNINMFINSKKDIKMCPKTKELFNKLFSKENENLISYIKSHYNNDMKLVELANYTGSNILIYAVQENNIEIVKYLLDNGFNVNCRDSKNGETALLRAIHFNRYDIIEILLKYNVDSSIVHNEMKITPLNLAIMRNKPLIVDLLMSHNIKFDYNLYISSKSNKYLKWEYVVEDVKRVIAKHKSKLFIINILLVFHQKLFIFKAIQDNTLNNKKLNIELLNS
jgi:ankyrin repeat protein